MEGQERKAKGQEGTDQKFPLPPCRVCNAPGTGFHYGANTCEACKGFFHRSLTYSARYKCDSNGSCIIQTQKGKLCRKCRYQKCLDQGMSKSAIKTGRYNYRKKTEDILEVKQLKVSEENVQAQNYLSPEVGEKRGAVAVLCLERLDLPPESDLFKNNALHKSGDDQANKSVHPIPLEVEGQSTNIEIGSSHEIKPSPFLLACVPEINDGLLDTPRPSSVSSVSGSSNHSSPNSAHSDLQLQQSSFSPNKISLDDEWPMTTLQPADSSYYDVTQSSANGKDMPPSPQHSFPGYSDSTPEFSRISYTEALESLDYLDKLFQDKESIIKTLVDAHDKYVLSLFPDIPKEEIARQQQEHYDGCLLHKEMFGGRHRLHDREYDDIFLKTGLDIDGRQWCMYEYAKGMEEIIQGMVIFAKVIPGFSNLTIDEKTSLVKYSRQEFIFLNLFKYINRELKVYKSFNRSWQCSMDMENSTMRQTLDQIFNFLAKFQLLDLAYTECVILQAMIIMAPDRSYPMASATVSSIYHKLTELLVYQMDKRMHRANLHFAKVMSLITECRTKEEDLTEMYKKENLLRYTPLSDQPILREMFTGIYIAAPGENTESLFTPPTRVLGPTAL